MKCDERKIFNLFDIVTKQNDIDDIKMISDIDNKLYIIENLLKSIETNNIQKITFLNGFKLFPIILDGYIKKQSNEQEFIDNFECFIKDTREYYLVKSFIRTLKISIINYSDLNPEYFFIQYNKVKDGYFNEYKSVDYENIINAIIKNLFNSDSEKFKIYSIFAFLLSLFEYLNINYEKIIIYIEKYEKLINIKN